MTIREKVQEKLLHEEVLKLKSTLISQLGNKLDEINCEVKRFCSNEIIEEYVKVSEQLIKVSKAEFKDLLEIDYNEIMRYTF